MSKLCCIPICPNSKTNRGTPCYPFPAADPVLRGKWIEFIGTESHRFRWRSKYICAEHFHQLDLVEDGSGQRLPADGAIPTIYSPDEADDDVLVERDRVMVSGSTSSAKPNEWTELQSMFCRICLKKSAGLIPFNSKLHNENLVDVVYTITGLELDEGETNLPSKICACCVGKIDLAFNVRKEFLHQEKVLRNMISNGQLEAHYRSYDNHVIKWKNHDEVYLSNLMENVKTELIIEPVEEMEEEHLQDEEEDTTEPPAESGSAGCEPQETKVTVEDYSHSDEEKNSKKVVYSWKDLYKPKRPRQAKEYKITEDLPEPELIPNTCYICDTVYEDAEALDGHIEGHVQLVPYNCSQCSTEEYPQVLKSLITLNKHLQSHLYPYVCDYCPLRYINKKNYILHMRSKHENISSDGFTCDDCGQFFTNKRSFSTHIYKHRAIKEEKYKCEHCGKAFSNAALLTRHVRIHTGERPYECNKCGKRFNHESIFQVHKRSHIGEKAHVCPECGKRFIIAPQLRYHMAEHFPDDPRYRTQYTKNRPQYQSIRDAKAPARAIVTDGKLSNPKERVCEFENCSYTTTSAQCWHYHRSMHIRKFQCEICAKRFPARQALVKHVETIHEGKPVEKNLACTYCDKKFSNNQKLRCHMDIHENNRRHKCSYCEKAFVQVANLKAHERIHTGEKPFPCRTCSAAFITSSGRKKHEKTHSELDGQQSMPTKVESGYAE
ncbi:AAEL013022-PA [Aedes aegypti]|uniref:AAEL013022-PA n=1 Tax=Aedes aegypti TaxID=7159 RepID=Q16KE9_AEDAE|nr:AAEL013022-PA [Aedes aegypti]